MVSFDIPEHLSRTSFRQLWGLTRPEEAPEDAVELLGATRDGPV